MLAWFLYSLFKRGWDRKSLKRPASVRSRLSRKSLKDLQVPGFLYREHKHSTQWFDHFFVPNSAIFECIMQFLDAQDSVKLILLCRSWSFSAAEAFYESPHLAGADSFSQLVAVIAKQKPMFSYALLVRELLLSAQVADNLLMGDLKQALVLCTNLISLHIEGCTHLSNLLAQFLTEHAPFLFRLELPGCYVSDSFVDSLFPGCNALRHLDLSHTSVTLGCLPRIIHECRFLETLDMTGVQSPGERPNTTLLDVDEDPMRPELRRVSFAGTDITDAIVGFLSKCCPNLECILIDGCNFITDSAALFIAQYCPKIQVLGLSFCLNISDVGLQSLAVHLSRHANPNILHPKVPKKRISYQSLQEYSAPPPVVVQDVQLQEIYLSGCYKITPSGLSLLCEKCPYLDCIVLDGCDQIIAWFAGDRSEKSDADSPVSQKDAGFDQDNLLVVSRAKVLDYKAELKRVLNPSPELAVNR